MNKNLKYFIIFALVVFAALLYLNNTMNDSTTSIESGAKKKEIKTLTYSQFRSMLTVSGQKKLGKIISLPDESPKKGLAGFLAGNKKSLTLEISNTSISGRYLGPGLELTASDKRDKIIERTFPFVVDSLPGTVSEELLTLLDKNGVVYRFKNDDEGGFFSAIIGWLPIIILMGLLWMFMMRQLQSTGNRAMSFGKSKARLTEDDSKKVTFSEVAGVEEAKTELWEVVDFLKDPRKFQAIGAKIPRGVLLVGPPGTGKTLLARAVSGEAGVPFYSISGSDFVEMFVGVGASRVRDLFEQAKKSSPCIIFIDEIDAVGRLRGAGLGGGHDEREQTLNQMLVEMDGFEENTGVIVIAATNRSDVLDPALLRPGRFDRQVIVHAPDVKGREAILEIHAKKIPLTTDVSMMQIARGTPGFTGADLANLINEAAILAARNEKKRVTMIELEEAKDKVMMGPERKSFIISPKEKEVIAYHEGGHALLGALLPLAEPVHKVTIIPRGQALGLTHQLPEEDRHIQPKKYWLDRICVLMGGFIAEESIFKDTATGASNDILVATNIARRMVCEWGMSEKIGTVNYSSEPGNVFLGRDFSSGKNHSEDTAQSIDVEVRRIIQEQLDRGRSLLKKNRKKLDAIAKELLIHESLTGSQLLEIIDGKSLPAPESVAKKKPETKKKVDPKPGKFTEPLPA